MSEHVARNREYWDDLATEYVEAGERAWAQKEPAWGIWQIPESELPVFPGQISGKDAIELGCGTAYISAWLSRRGVRAVGIDNSKAQLETARRLQLQYGLDFPLIHGNAESVPYPDGSFDFAISEYGACLWADPHLWIPEAARLLRPGGQLVFLTNSFLLMLCVPDEDSVAATERLLRPAFGMYRVEWPGNPALSSICHTATGYGCCGVRVLRLRISSRYGLLKEQSRVIPSSLANGPVKWPCEEVWKARKTGF